MGHESVLVPLLQQHLRWGARPTQIPHLLAAMGILRGEILIGFVSCPMLSERCLLMGIRWKWFYCRRIAAILLETM